MKKKNIINANIINDRVSLVDNNIDESTGFMHSKVVMCRSGIQEYYGYELGLTGDDARKIYKVLRHPDDVKNKESIATFNNIIVTDEHPTEGWIDIYNVKNYQKGQVSNIELVNDTADNLLTVNGLSTITDANLIEKVQNGKVEVSLGYSHDLVAEDGEYGGESYQYRFINIVANHLSVVEKGRCGKKCRIIDKNYDTISDEKNNGGKEKMKIKINGQEFDVDDAVAKAILAERASRDADLNESTKKVEESTKKAEDLEKEVTETKKANDALQAQLDTAREKKITDADIDAIVKDRAELVAFAKSVIGDSMPTCTDPIAIKTAVVEKHFGISLDGKGEAYIEARFDIVQEDMIARDSSVVAMGADIEKAKKIATDNEKVVQDAREKYLKSKGL